MSAEDATMKSSASAIGTKRSHAEVKDVKDLVVRLRVYPTAHTDEYDENLCEVMVTR
jgi:hypothetical protein